MAKTIRGLARADQNAKTRANTVQKGPGAGKKKPDKIVKWAKAGRGDEDGDGEGAGNEGDEGDEGANGEDASNGDDGDANDDEDDDNDGDGDGDVDGTPEADDADQDLDRLEYQSENEGGEGD